MRINTAANKITVARMFLGGFPPAITIYYWHNNRAAMIICFLWVLAWELSDIIDGWLARRSGNASEIGKLMDPLADIKMHIPIFVVLAWLEVCPMWAVLIIIMRELSITGGRAILAALKNGEANGARLIGKVKTWGYAVVILLTVLFLAIRAPHPPTVRDQFLIDAVFYLTAGISFYTWVDYGLRFWRKISPFL